MLIYNRAQVYNAITRWGRRRRRVSLSLTLLAMVTSQSKRRRWSPARHWALLLCDQTWPSKTRRNQRERGGKKSARCLSTTIRLPYTQTHNISQLSHPPYRQVHLVSLLLLHSNTHTQREPRHPWEKNQPSVYEEEATDHHLLQD